MTDIRRTWGQIALLVLALLGVGISIYLTTIHYEHIPPICSTSGLIDCGLVLSSPFAVVPGTQIPISVPGLLWCLAAAALAFAIWRIWPEQRGLRIVQSVWTVLGMLTVFYLIYVELVKLHAICIWCTALHVIIFSMLLIAVVQLQEPGLAIEFEEEEEEKPTVTARHG